MFASSFYSQCSEVKLDDAADDETTTTKQVCEVTRELLQLPIMLNLMQKKFIPIVRAKLKCGNRKFVYVKYQLAYN